MNWQYRAIIQRLMSLRGFLDFYVQYSKNNVQDKPIENMINGYKEYCSSNNMPISDEENQLINNLKDKLLELNYRENGKLLFFIGESFNNDGTTIEEFREDWEKAQTGRFATKLRDRQTYKTIQEFFILREYNDNGILSKYHDNPHPLVSQILGSSLINGGFYQKGLPLILRGLLYANNPNNPYWHSLYGIYGCTWSLWEFIRLFKLSRFKDKYDAYYKHLVKLLYLYLSRSIAFSEIKLAAQGHDFYRNRADIQRDNYTIMMAIFSDYGLLFTNMDIQYMSDCYLAFSLCSKCKCAGIAEQAFKDAQKMYRYSSLNFLNEDNGIREIEDASFFELVERGRIRANVVAEKILNEYITGSIRIPEYIFEEMFVELMNNYQDNPEYIEWHE